MPKNFVRKTSFFKDKTQNKNGSYDLLQIFWVPVESTVSKVYLTFTLETFLKKVQHNLLKRYIG